MKRRFARWPSHRTNTIDQRLLAEIRDGLEALPLAKELKHHDVETAKKLRRELEQLHERIEHLESVNRLLQRAAGIDAEVLSEDELELLTELGARS